MNELFEKNYLRNHVYTKNELFLTSIQDWQYLIFKQTDVKMLCFTKNPNTNVVETSLKQIETLFFRYSQYSLMNFSLNEQALFWKQANLPNLEKSGSQNSYEPSTKNNFTYFRNILTNCFYNANPLIAVENLFSYRKFLMPNLLDHTENIGKIIQIRKKLSETINIDCHWSEKLFHQLIHCNHPLPIEKFLMDCFYDSEALNTQEKEPNLIKLKEKIIEAREFRILKLVSQQDLNIIRDTPKAKIL